MKPRSLVFDLYGDYVRYRGGEAGLADLLVLLAQLGVNEQSARVLLSRLKREGWLATRREGRASFYGLNDRSWRLLDEGRSRIFQRRTCLWDGRWRMVLYSVPETERGVRERLRRALSWAGFGPLASAVWMCPYDRFAELGEALVDAGLKVDLERFTADSDGQERDRELAARCFDLEGIQAGYCAFLERWQPRVDAHRATPLAPAEAFAERVRLVHDYRKFPFGDPDLPADLLPADWAGAPAHALFLSGSQLLRTPAFAHYDAVALRTQPPAAGRTPRPETFISG